MMTLVKQKNGRATRAEKILASIWESSQTLRALAREAKSIEQAGKIIIDGLRKKGKLVACGNGGSAADAQHLVAELSGRFERDRPGLPAVALTTNTSSLTAIANDYDYSMVFTRQMEGLMGKNDVLVAISTSGNSQSVIDAAKSAKRQGAKVIGWTGRSGGKLAAHVDVCLKVPSDRTCRVQEGHLCLLHTLCTLIEEELFPVKKKK
jgi:D-sedoheptulose 7-phosphate isomerase